MRVQLLGEISGLRNGRPWPPPLTLVDLPDDEAIRLCETNMARPAVDPDSGLEMAVVAPVAVEARDALVPTTRTRVRTPRAAAPLPK
jgi:hypothetical protein